MIKKAEANALPLNPCEDGLPGYYIAAARPFYCSKGYDMLNVDISLNGRVVARYFADPVTREHKAHLIGKTWSTIKLKNIIQKAAERSRDLRLVEYKELRDKKETVRRGLLAGQLLADVLEADLVEAI